MYLSLYIICNDLLLGVYFIFILDQEMMLDKKQIQAIFLLVFKMSHKTLDIIFYINNGPEIAKEHTVHWWFKKFCKGDESLEAEECSAWPLKVDNDQ